MTAPATPPPAGTPSFSTGEESRYVNTLFLGPDGLRPGWGLLIYVLLYELLQPYLGAAGYNAMPNHPMWSLVLEKAADLAAALIPALVLLRVERRPWRSYGLPLNQSFRLPYWTGALWGFASLSVLVGALYVFHGYDFGHLILHGARIEKFGLYWAVMFLLVGLHEEFLFRGYSLFTLARGVRFWPSAVVCSCVFAYVHRNNPGETPVGLLGVFAIGLFFCLTLQRTGSLWFAVGFHAAWDWGETYFYSVPDSGWLAPGRLFSAQLHGPKWLTGGTVGPEASVFCFAVIALTAVVFAGMHPSERVRRAKLPAASDTATQLPSDHEHRSLD